MRNLKAAILNEEVSLGKREDGLDDAEIEKVVAREVKKRVESADLYRKNDRAELAEPEEKRSGNFTRIFARATWRGGNLKDWKRSYCRYGRCLNSENGTRDWRSKKVRPAMLRMARWWQKLLKKNSQNRRKK
ncbi:GatB/YqeY domain-containing protein [Candidatus Minimicrobia naudis]